ncbi:hypothetical protein [Engelhardtia mirabilis]|uniref:Uncharacterized protein n=1 Tax=Engelhardtia mirabilis TaxID=2528011 RepID=A0A518BGQ0_9BACT|nr:hypothetical protein Pla133_12000 [Planctomycetes bacterium Pla133]QDV00461.1 hypothetical protein Pla86_12000 [Planctomycetes bacterium Pla86]
MTETHEDLSDEFWERLIDERALSPELAQDYRTRSQSPQWLPLGSVLIRRGNLRMEQLVGLLAIQKREPFTRLGDLAVREGYCTADEVAAALQFQRSINPGPIDLVLREEGLTDPVSRALVGYAKYLEAEVMRLRESVPQGQVGP